MLVATERHERNGRVCPIKKKKKVDCMTQTYTDSINYT